MEDERQQQTPEQTPSLDPQSQSQSQSAEIARLKQEHQTEIAQWQKKTAQLEEKSAQLEEELAQLKKTTSGAGKNQGEEATPGSPQQPNLPPRKQRRGSVVENLAGEYRTSILCSIPSALFLSVLSQQSFIYYSLYICSS